jgi:hypothetical protein
LTTKNTILKLHEPQKNSIFKILFDAIITLNSMIKKRPLLFPSLKSKAYVLTSEVLHKVEGTKKNKNNIVPSIFMKF